MWPLKGTYEAKAVCKLLVTQWTITSEYGTIPEISHWIKYSEARRQRRPLYNRNGEHKPHERGLCQHFHYLRKKEKFKFPIKKTIHSLACWNITTWKRSWPLLMNDFMGIYIIRFSLLSRPQIVKYLSMRWTSPLITIPTNYPPPTISCCSRTTAMVGIFSYPCNA